MLTVRDLAVDIAGSRVLRGVSVDVKEGAVGLPGGTQRRR